MLGFACLWDAHQLQRSVEATTKYLQMYPQDKEARLWLMAAKACLLSPDNEAERQTFFDEFAPLLQGDPMRIQRVREMASDGDEDDFRGWRGLPQFQQLLSAFVDSPSNAKHPAP